jgi:ureidoglycolate hydrolase
MIEIEPVLATSEKLAGFGHAVTAPQTAPTSQAVDYKFWSDLGRFRIEGDTEVGICTVYRQAVNEITAMEKHVWTPEILIPIDAPFVVPLLRDGDGVDKAMAFRVRPGECIVINQGVWHGACLPVGVSESSYFVIFKRNTPLEDVQKKTIPTFIIVLK